MNSKNIWLEKQNKPSLVVRDLAGFAPESSIYYSLLRRGVFKWLAVRRDLIRLKDIWKSDITSTIEQIKEAKKVRDYKTLYQLRGQLKMLEQHRAQVRALCHSPRFRAPDNDRGAQRYLNKL